MQASSLRTILFSLLLVLPLSAGACGGEEVGNEGTLVGGSCESDSDCDEDCLTGGDYPEGICSVSCATDDDCPGGTHCIDEDGGICMLACEVPSDCRGGYTCQGEENRGHGGDSLVCSKD